MFSKLSLLSSRLPRATASFSTAQSINRAARIARMSKPQPLPTSSSSSSSNSNSSGSSKSSSSPPLNKNFLFGALLVVITSAAAATYDITVLGDEGFLSSLDLSSFSLSDLTRSLSVPATSKLIPDFESGPVYGTLPPGAVAPPLLVLDLEGTLIASTHDARHGWRHARRPGLDKFLRQLSPYFELAVVGASDKGAVAELCESLADREKGVFLHSLGASDCEARGDLLLKRLDLMNRPLQRVILIDDDPEAAQLFPRNTLIIKQFDLENGIDTESESSLLELVPLLQALVHEGVEDYREAFDSLGTRSAHEAAVEYRVRVSSRRAQEAQKRRRGLGLFIRGNDAGNDGLTDAYTHGDARILSPEQIVGSAPVITPSFEVKDKLTGRALPREKSEKKKGLLLQWVESGERQREEREKEKEEVMTQMHYKKMEERARREGEARMQKEDLELREREKSKGN